MQHPLRLLTPAVLALSASFAHADIVVDAGRGPVTIEVPASYDPENPAPLVILLHGYGANGPAQESYMQFGELVDEYGFLYAYPNGTVDQAGNRFWNATDACCDFFDTGIDDVGYLLALIDEVKAQLTVDPRRVHFIGHSNGGFMSYRMACDHPGTVASIASLAGATFFNPDDCAAASPVHVLQIHGTADTTISYFGGIIFDALYPSATETVEQWADVAGCLLIPDNSAPPINLVSNIAGPETTVTRYESDCDAAGSAELWSMQGAGHSPSLSNPFNNLVIEFLLAHPKPGLGESYCAPVANSTGRPGVMRVTGSTTVGDDDLLLSAVQLPTNSNIGYFIMGTGTNTFTPPGAAGPICITPGLLRYLPPVSNTSELPGGFSRTVGTTGPISSNITPGSTWNFQAWHRDSMAGTSNLTDAVSVTFE